MNVDIDFVCASMTIILLLIYMRNSLPILFLYSALLLSVLFRYLALRAPRTKARVRSRLFICLLFFIYYIVGRAHTYTQTHMMNRTMLSVRPGAVICVACSHPKVLFGDNFTTLFDKVYYNVIAVGCKQLRTKHIRTKPNKEKSSPNSLKFLHCFAPFMAASSNYACRI